MAAIGWGRLAALGAGALVLGGVTAALLPAQAPSASPAVQAATQSASPSASPSATQSDTQPDTQPAGLPADPSGSIASSAISSGPSSGPGALPVPSSAAASPRTGTPSPPATKTDAELQPALVLPAKGPKAATREHKAKRVPAEPPDSYIGRRIVYDKALMTVWLVESNGKVVGQYPVVGRWDRPLAGVYHVYSKSPASGNPFSKVTFNHMTRFAHGYTDERTPIGFHSIPRYYDGSLMHAVDQLGLPIATGGCVRMSDEAAEAVYEFARIGTMVVVLPSP